MSAVVPPIDPNPPPWNGVNGAANDANTWGPPDHFDVLDVPEFPIAALSPWLREWTAAVANFAQVPSDLPGTVALAAASLAVCRRFHVQVKEGWREPTNLYVVAALGPGERKSAVFEKATAPVMEYHKELCAQLASRIMQRETERDILQAQIVAAKQAAAKHKPYEGDAWQSAMELSARLADLPELHVPALIADDVTAEALALLLAQGGERLGIFSPEGNGPFAIMAGRYSESGAANLEIFLKGHSGDHHKVNRIKRQPISLSHPLVVMAFTVQPEVIQGLAKKEGFRGLGLLARFLYSLPKSLMGHREVEPPPVPATVERNYHVGLSNMLRLASDDRPLMMSMEANRARSRFHRDLEPRLGPDGDLFSVTDWAGKLVGTTCRIAGVLHVADHAFHLESLPESISGDAFERAEALALYFLEHAKGAFQTMGTDETTELARRVWKWIGRRVIGDGKHTFTAREARRGVHKQEPEVKPALAQLIERNLVRPLPPSTTGGRPSEIYQVRP